MEERTADREAACKCPYCDAEMEADEMPVFCRPCAVTIVKCESCGGPVRLGSDACPGCGEKTG